MNTDIERYNLGRENMEVAPDGMYVEYLDHCDAIAELEDKLRRARRSVLQMATAIGKEHQAEYERGVRTMAANLYHYFGSVSEMERNAEHNDEVLGAMTKSLANFDGKLNMNLSQSEEYVEAIYDAANKAAAEGREL